MVDCEIETTAVMLRVINDCFIVFHKHKKIKRHVQNDCVMAVANENASPLLRLRDKLYLGTLWWSFLICRGKVYVINMSWRNARMRIVDDDERSTRSEWSDSRVVTAFLFWYCANYYKRLVRHYEHFGPIRLISINFHI